jgi:hypothetical protein
MLHYSKLPLMISAMLSSDDMVFAHQSFSTGLTRGSHSSLRHLFYHHRLSHFTILSFQDGNPLFSTSAYMWITMLAAPSALPPSPLALHYPVFSRREPSFLDKRIHVDHTARCAICYTTIAPRTSLSCLFKTGTPPYLILQPRFPRRLPPWYRTTLSLAVSNLRAISRLAESSLSVSGHFRPEFTFSAMERSISGL